MKKIIMFLLLILSSSCVNRLAFTETVNTPVNLIEGFKSYLSIEEVRQYCISQGYPWAVIEDSRLPKEDKRPQFDIFIVEIDKYKHLGQTGTLRLRFFNNRLSDIWFYPSDLTMYIESLLNKENIDLINFEERTLENLRVWKHKDYRKKFYIGWVDIKLEQEEFDWIKKYS